VNKNKKRIEDALKAEHFQKIGLDTWKLDYIKVHYLVSTKSFIASWGMNDIDIKKPEDVKTIVCLYEVAAHDPFWNAATYQLTKTFT
jgi:hypothetical protein